jgi:hypothetical protein
LPDLDASIWSKYRGKGVLVFGLHPNEPAQQLNDFVKQTGISYPVLADRNSTLSKFAFPSGVGYPYPRDVIVGKDLTVRAIRNSFNVREVESLVQKLLAE